MSWTLGPWDTAVLALYLILVLVFGIWSGRRQRDARDYFLADKNLPWWAILGSIVATETSTASFLSVPGQAFASDGGDLRFLQLAIGYILGRWLIVKTLLPHYFRGEIETAYTLLAHRFGDTARQLVAILFLSARTLGDGVRLFLAALALDQVMGMGIPACVGMLGLVTIVYTVFGGLRSVVWNDCFQLAIYVLGAVATLFVITARLPDGAIGLWRFAVAHGKLHIFDLRLDPASTYTLWSGVLGGMMLSMASHGADHLMVQRLLAARSEKEAGRALVWSGWVVFAQFALFLGVGIGLAAYFDQPGREMSFERNDAVFPYFIAHELPPGLTGLTIAAVLAAAMSTLASSLSASASSLASDLLKPWGLFPADAGRALGWGRALTVLFGLLQIGVGMTAPFFVKSVIDAVLAIGGFTAGIILGVFLLGIWTRDVSQFAAIAGLTGGMFFMSVVAFGTSTAWPWFALLGSAATFGLGWAMHHFTARRRV